VLARGEPAPETKAMAGERRIPRLRGHDPVMFLDGTSCEPIHERRIGPIGRSAMHVLPCSQPVLVLGAVQSELLTCAVGLRIFEVGRFQSHRVALAGSTGVEAR
jgi:hypothetical protein